MGYENNYNTNPKAPLINPSENRGDVEAALEVALKLHGAQLIELIPGGPRVASLPNAKGGIELLSVKGLIEEYADRPDRKEGTAILTSIESFIAFVNRHKDPSSAVFANTGDSPSLSAIFDYHDIDGENSLARFCEHKAHYSFPLSKEWLAWKLKNERWLDQADFAALLEERIADVADPSLANDAVHELLQTIECELAGPAKLMSLSRGLSIRVESKVTNATRLSSGETQMMFVSEHKDESGAPISVPGAFLLAIPLFRGGSLYRIPVRLRYRTNQGKISWSIALYRTEEVFDHAVQEAIKAVSEGTGLPVFEGTPES